MASLVRIAETRPRCGAILHHPIAIPLPVSPKGPVVPVVARSARAPDLRARGRAHGVLLGGAVTLLALVAYQGFALASDGAEYAVLPGDQPLLAPDEPAPAGLEAPIEADIEVVVDVLPRARLRPGPRPCAVFVGDQSAPQARATWLAGSAAGPGAGDVRAGDQQLLAVELGSTTTYRWLTVRDPDALAVHLLGDVEVQGQVCDVDGRPLAGASLWVSGVEAKSGEDGSFAVVARGGEGLVAVARADGMVSQAIGVAAAGARGLRFVMQPAGELRARVLGPLPKQQPARVLVAPASPAQTSDQAQYPFFLQALTGGVAVDARGIALLRDLPIGMSVQVGVTHPQLLASACPVVEVRARTIDLGVPVGLVESLHGRVLDGEGRACASAMVAAWPDVLGDDSPRPAAGVQAVPPAAWRADLACARVAADGSFSLPRAALVLRVCAAAPARAAADLVVKPEAAAELALLLPPAVAAQQAPRLQLCAPQAGRYRVELRENGRPSRLPVAWTGDVPFSLPLRTAALADVLVRVSRGGESREQIYRAVAVADAVDLQLPK